MMEAAPPNHTDAAKPTAMLVVDDHDLVRLGLRTLVQSHAASSGQAVQVFEARTLQEALVLYRDQQTAIGLVLLDLHLPDAHGLSGLVSFIEHFPAARVVVLSAVSDPALVREAMTRGATPTWPSRAICRTWLGTSAHRVCSVNPGRRPA